MTCAWFWGSVHKLLTYLGYLPYLCFRSDRRQDRMPAEAMPTSSHPTTTTMMLEGRGCTNQSFKQVIHLPFPSYHTTFSYHHNSCHQPNFSPSSNWNQLSLAIHPFMHITLKLVSLMRCLRCMIWQIVPEHLRRRSLGSHEMRLFECQKPGWSGTGSMKDLVRYHFSRFLSHSLLLNHSEYSNHN